MIRGDGPRPATIAVVGEAPAVEEVRLKRALVGPSGKVTWAFFGMLTGLRREQVFVTNLWQEPFTPAQEKAGLDAIEMAIGGAQLEAELADVNPTFVLALGKHSTAHFLGKLPDEIQMETIHGLVFEDTLQSRFIVPAFHPAAGMRDSKRLTYSYHDFRTFADLIAGRAKVWEPRTSTPTYRQASLADVKGGLRWERIAIDTEYDSKGIIMLTFSVRRNEGFAIYKDQKALLAAFAKRLAQDRPLVIFHNALADISQLQSLGIDVPALGLTIRDTMIRAWYRESEAQGLKRLAYRHLGVDRSDFEGTVAPYFEAQLISYLQAADAMFPRTLIPQIGKRGKPIKPKPAPMTPLQRRISRLLGDHRSGKIKDLLKRWENWPDELKDEVEAVLGKAPEFSIRDVPADVAIPYACSDTDDTLGVFEALPPYDRNLEALDNAKLPLIAEMQSRGMLVDEKARQAFEEELADELENRLASLRALAEWPEFNPKSGDDVARVLYGFDGISTAGIATFMKDREYLDPPSFTKGGRPKTDKKALGTLGRDNPFIGELLAYKEVDKLKNTYVTPLPNYYRPGTFILPPTFAHTRVPSGRLAARRPNIMAIPSRTDLGKRVRGLFIARPGFRFVSFDHSQIELAVAAQETGDPKMVAILNAGADMHIETAAGLDPVRPASDTAYWKKGEGAPMRQVAKMLNYLMLYGGTAERFYLELLAAGITRYSLEQAQRFHSGWLQLYAGVAASIERVTAELRSFGYVTDMWGRRRTLPGAHLYGRFWPMSMLREEAIRQGFSLKVQGGAQGLIIRAMVKASQVVLPLARKMGILVFPLLQIHDELMFEIEDDDEKVELFQMLMLDAMMADQPLFKVPIESTASQAYTWGGLK
jgi:uracil-DNA glycosylase family 4